MWPRCGGWKEPAGRFPPKHLSGVSTSDGPLAAAGGGVPFHRQLNASDVPDAERGLPHPPQSHPRALVLRPYVKRVCDLVLRPGKRGKRSRHPGLAMTRALDHAGLTLSSGLTSGALAHWAA